MFLLCILSCLVATSFACSCCDTTEQVHIAQGITPASMQVSWVSSCEQCTSVAFGTTSGSYTQRVRGPSTQYSFHSRKYPAYTSGHIFHAPLDSLEPSTTYYYMINSESSSEVCPEFSFHTAPAVGDREETVFGIVADLGQTSDSQLTVNQMNDDDEVTMILHAGDMSYADCDQRRWDTWANLVQPLASRVPWMVGVGNHEIELEDDTQELFKPYKYRFAMPAAKPAEDSSKPGSTSCTPSVYTAGNYSYGNSFYSFEASAAHVIVLNSYTSHDTTAPQYTWLQADLASIDRLKTPWVIVLMHCPWYNSNTAHDKEAQTVTMMANLEHLLYAHRVNAVIAGHVHAYERSYPIYQGKRTDDGIQYFNIGDGGNREGHAAHYHTQPSWSAFRDGLHFGAARMRLVNSTHMRWEWRRNVDGGMETADQSWILNDFALRHHIS